MTGSVDIVIHSARIRYEFCINRNITVIRGKGATGKTTLYDMVRLSSVAGSGIKATVSKNVILTILTAGTWELVLENIKESNYILF